MRPSLLKLTELQDGWLDGYGPTGPYKIGKAYDYADLEKADQMVTQLLAALRLPEPYIYPNPDGRIRLEFPNFNGHDLLWDLDPRTEDLELTMVKI